MKMNRKIFLPILGVAVTAAMVSCSTISNDGSAGKSDTAEESRNQFARQSEKLGGEMLIALQKGDGEKFISLLPEEMRKKFGEKEFKATSEELAQSMGRIEKFEYLCSLDAPVFKSYLWKVRFQRRGMRDPEKNYSQETLFRIVTGELDGKPHIVSFGFL